MKLLMVVMLVMLMIVLYVMAMKTMAMMITEAMRVVVAMMETQVKEREPQNKALSVPLCRGHAQDTSRAQHVCGLVT